jgi:hypothetical protein
VFTRRQLLFSSAAAALLPTLSRAASGSRPKRLIYIFADGGWDTQFCLEPKFSSPDVDGPWVDEDPTDPDDVEYERTFGDYSVVLNDKKRPSVTEFFEGWGSRCSVISGIWTGAIAHDTSRVRLLTGSQLSTNPDLNTIVGSVLGRDLPLGSVDLSGLSLSGRLAASTGQVGFQSQVATLLDPTKSFPAPPATGLSFPQWVTEDADEAAIRTFLKARTEAFGDLHVDGGRNSQRIADRLESIRRAEQFLREGTSVLDSLVPGERPTFELQLTLGVDLLERDLCRSIMVETTQHWDSHDSNVSQHGFYEKAFAGMNHLAQLLDDRGMADDTLVVLVSEMTRTPKLNSRLGKDHWPHCSALLLGGGFPQARRFGGTDDYVESQPMDLATGELTEAGQLLKYDNFVAGMLAGMDIDPAEWFPGITPFTGWIG